MDHPELLSLEPIVLGEERLDLVHQRGGQVADLAGRGVGRRGRGDADQAVVPDRLAAPLALLRLEDPDEANVDEAAGGARRAIRTRTSRGSPSPASVSGTKPKSKGKVIPIGRTWLSRNARR